MQKAARSVYSRSDSLRPGRLRDLHTLMYSVRHHRPALTLLLGEEKAREFRECAFKMRTIIASTPGALDPHLAVVCGAVTREGTPITYNSCGSVFPIARGVGIAPAVGV